MSLCNDQADDWTPLNIIRLLLLDDRGSEVVISLSLRLRHWRYFSFGGVPLSTVILGDTPLWAIFSFVGGFSDCPNGCSFALEFNRCRLLNLIILIIQLNWSPPISEQWYNSPLFKWDSHVVHSCSQLLPQSITYLRRCNFPESSSWNLFSISFRKFCSF